uniref:Uncharacterized protein n=1 Tax=Magallana gigas TaxID=29159 RepID=A0A8W8MDH0_MAGGI
MSQPTEDDLTPTMSTPQSMEQEQKLTDTCEGVTTREHRTLSEKGLMFYQSRVDHLSAKLTRVGKDLYSLLNTTICEETDIELLSKRLFEVYKTYENLSSDFLNFLIRHNTDDSAREQAGLTLIKATYAQRVEQFVKKMDSVHRVREPKTKSNSFKSARSSSKSSSVASLLGRQRAKREAAKVKLMFAEQEAMLKAKMDVLSVRKEAAVADAEYLGMKEELDFWDEDSVCDDNNNSDILTKYFCSQLMENDNTDAQTGSVPPVFSVQQRSNNTDTQTGSVPPVFSVQQRSNNTDTQTGSVPPVFSVQQRSNNTDTQTGSVPPVFSVQQHTDTKTGATTRTCTKREDQVMPSTERTRPPITSSLNAYAPTFQPTNHSSPAQPKLSQVKSSQPASSQPSQPSQPEAPQPALLSEDSFKKNNVQVKKTAVNTSQEDSNINIGNNCFLHVSRHKLNQCKTFQKLTLNEHIPMSSVTTYSLKSCAGTFQRSGRQASGLVVESNNGSCRLLLPRVTECEQIPEEESEIPTPDIVKFHSHLSGVDIPPLNQKAQVLLLIGRELLLPRSWPWDGFSSETFVLETSIHLLV